MVSNCRPRKGPAARAARRAKPVLALALSLAALHGGAWAEPAGPAKVALQLKWRHQFQFAGYYIAARKGYYRDAGLDVEIREGSPSTRVTDEVVQGRAQYGINNTDLLIDRIKGKRVVVLAVIFQHSPTVLLSLARNSLASPKDFIGRKVMASIDSEAEIFSMFSNEGVKLSAVDFIPHTWKLDDLVEGRTDALSAYATNEALALKARGIPFTAVKPLLYGIDFYGDCLFTSEAELKAHPARTAAFLAASLRGWEYAMDKPEEACDLILSDYSREKDKAALMAEAQAMDELIVHRFVPIGFMNPGRWRHIGDTYAKLGAIPAGYSLDGFLYDPKAPSVDLRVLKLAIAILAAAMAIAIAYILILRAFNSRLETEVATRTLGLEELNRTLSAEVTEGKEKERIIALSLAEKQVLLKEVHHRVKNNLQVICSILNMQIEATEEPRDRENLLAVKNRVFSMALVHERLYGSQNLSSIDLGDYLKSLVDEIVMGHKRPGLEVETMVETEDTSLEADRIIPLGLIVGELVSNSMKHAFPRSSQGRIEVSLHIVGGRYELRVADDGLQADESFAKARAAGIGLQLVEALAAQLGGELSRETGKGCVYRLSFS